MSTSQRSVRSAAPSPSPHYRSDSIDGLKIPTSDSDTPGAPPSSSINVSAVTELALADDDMIGRLLLSLFPSEDPEQLLAPAQRKLSADEVAERQCRDDGVGLAVRVLAKGGYAVFEFAEDGEHQDSVVGGVEEMVVETVEASDIKEEDASKCCVQ
ncbi:hypothetical protein BC567DRAFT_286105 [Phyllosticta citribraziliensis]